MSSSQVLEVAIGLMFVYLLLSTACSGIKEIIARLLDMRAKTLEGAIRNMLADPNNEITKEILQNHVIAGTVQAGTKPPYISSRNFALALFDFVAPPKGRSIEVHAGSESWSQQAASALPKNSSGITGIRSR